MTIKRRMVGAIAIMRVYSLFDLTYMLIAVGIFPSSRSFGGALWLWIGFLIYLEYAHEDKGRGLLREGSYWAMWLAAVAELGDKGRITAPLYMLLSILYSKKKERPWGKLSPFIRGAQTATMLIGLSGHALTWRWIAIVSVASALVALRNFWGDARDTSYDREDNIETWATAFKMKDHPFAHLFCVLGTTFVWWLYAGNLHLTPLVVAWTVEILTYWLTPRQSNKKAFTEMRRLRSCLGFH